MQLIEATQPPNLFYGTAWRRQPSSGSSEQADVFCGYSLKELGKGYWHWALYDNNGVKITENTGQYGNRETAQGVMEFEAEARELGQLIEQSRSS